MAAAEKPILLTQSTGELSLGHTRTLARGRPRSLGDGFVTILTSRPEEVSGDCAELHELLPSILPQLGADNMDQLRKLAQNFPGAGAMGRGGPPGGVGTIEEEDEGDGATPPPQPAPITCPQTSSAATPHGVAHAATAAEQARAECHVYVLQGCALPEHLPPQAHLCAAYRPTDQWRSQHYALPQHCTGILEPQQHPN